MQRDPRARREALRRVERARTARRLLAGVSSVLSASGAVPSGSECGTVTITATATELAGAAVTLVVAVVGP